MRRAPVSCHLGRCHALMQGLRNRQRPAQVFALRHRMNDAPASQFAGVLEYSFGYRPDIGKHVSKCDREAYRIDLRYYAVRKIALRHEIIERQLIGSIVVGAIQWAAESY
jgi:hypothetical protein